MFSKLGGMFKKPGDGDGEGPAFERVFESHHLKADRSGVLLCVSIRCESVTDREAGIVFAESNALLDDACTGLIVDLGHVEVLTSAGIGTLVRLHKRMEERKGRLAVCALNEELAELFRLTRIDRLFVLTDDRNTALRELGA
ncbi:MAG: STAS domain-containing protein [Phycisphaerales bacterium]|nr:STAS domain-containing protein [Phycisphaerales bacterium]